MGGSEAGRRCGHCGRGGATAWAEGVPLCHTDNPALPDCYRRVTVWGETVGVLLGLEVKPGGLAGISPETDAFLGLTALSEELGLYAEDEEVRAAVSRQWADDWDSGEDAAYDGA